MQTLLVNNGRGSHRTRRGFSLIEIMVVLGIIAVLSGMAIQHLVPMNRAAQYMAAKSDLRSIGSALSAYELNARVLPNTQQGLEALIKPPQGDPRPQRWIKVMDNLPRDPWGNPYVYRNPGKRNPDSYDLLSMGVDGVESDDDAGNWEPY